MNPCFIYKLLPIYIAALFIINPVHSTDPGGSTGSNPNPDHSQAVEVQNETQSLIYIDLDLTKTQSTEQVHYNKEGKIEMYTAKPGFAIRKYTDGSNISVTSGDTRHFSKIEKLNISDESRYRAFKYYPEQSKIIISTQDPNDNKKTIINDNTQYDINLDDDFLEYKFKENVKCTSISFDGKDVWKHDTSKSESPFPVSVVFYIIRKKFFVMFKDTMNIYKLEKDKWELTFDGEPGILTLNVMKKKSANEYDYTNDNGIGTYVAKDGYFFNVVKRSGGFLGSSSSDCCGSNCCSSDCCKSDCCKSDCCGSCCSFSCLFQWCCFFIPWFTSCGVPQTIWEHDDFNYYATKVVVNKLKCCSAVSMITVEFFNGKIKYLDEFNSSWSERGTITTVPIVIDGKQATYCCYYFKENNKHTYVAKPSHLFKSLLYTKSDSKHDVIWETKDPNQYMSEVVYDEIDAKNLVVEVFHVNGMTRKFTKPSDGQWKESETNSTDSVTTPNSGGTPPVSSGGTT